jgi:hypothetical protein
MRPFEPRGEACRFDSKDIAEFALGAPAAELSQN